jgi:pilus assembly protein Flp/PilA
VPCNAAGNWTRPDCPRLSGRSHARPVLSSSVFLKQEDGPTAAEYAVMLALIIAVIISVSNIGQTTNSTYADPRLGKATQPSSGS